MDLQNIKENIVNNVYYIDKDKKLTMRNRAVMSY
jgi:hypothetical protein